MEGGLAAGRRSYHECDCQHGKGRAYQHENAAAYLRGVGVRCFRCDWVGAWRLGSEIMDFQREYKKKYITR